MCSLYNHNTGCPKKAAQQPIKSCLVIKKTFFEEMNFLTVRKICCFSLYLRTYLTDQESISR